MMSCRQFTRSLTDYMEGEASLGKRMGIVAHSLLCSHCRRYARQLSIVVSIAEIAEETADDNLEPVPGEDALLASFEREHGASNV